MSKFTPSPQEVFLVNQIFAQADSQKLGVVTGDAAVKIFNGSKLPPSVLAEVWNIADEDNNGVLTRKGVAIAVRLLGHAQRGESMSEALIHKPGNVPVIEGLTPPITQQTTGVPSPKSPPPGLPPVTAQDRAKFMKLFIGCGPTSGILSGDQARDVFVKSKLPVDKLSQIWNLADTKSRGVLDATDFTIAMYFIQGAMSGQIKTIPPVLPSGFYEQAAGESGFKAVAAHATGESGSFSPSINSSFGRPVQAQYTGSSVLQPQMTGQSRPAPNPPARQATSAPAFPFVQQHSTGLAQQWDVTPAEKASADRFFDGLDTQKKGYIEGDIAVHFMLQSKLPEDVLAHVWDLADLSNDGRLTRDGFAVAMHLIQGKVAGKEVPATLPPSLVPPSMRSQLGGVPAVQSAQDSIRDLIWDDSPPSSATFPQQPPPILQPQSTGTRSPPPQIPLSGSPQPLQSRAPPVHFGGSPFGPNASTPTAHKDLLGDDDEPATNSPPLHDQSAEIGNVKNQLGSTTRSLDTARAERENVERTLAEQATQLSALQTQLSSAKAQYETETRLLATLRERYAAQTADIQKTREELIHAESNLSGIRVEKAEVEGSVLRDKEEVRELQRKMTEVGLQMETFKVDVEKAKKEAKQQKGLLAIAKKQLATREAERSKVEKEREEAQAEAQAAVTEREAAEAELAQEAPVALPNGSVLAGTVSPDLALAAAQPLPVTPEISSPTASVVSMGKSNNPFERVGLASGQNSRSQSPFLPFATSTLPTPPTAPVVAEMAADESSPTPSGNPFRFSDAFGLEESQPTSQALTDAAESAFDTSKPQSATPVLRANGNSEVVSPTGTEMFSTPPTTATISVPQSTDVDSLGVSVSYFPEIDSVASAAAAGAPPLETTAPPEGEHQTDLNHELKELEVDESDSESETDGDDEPLANVKTRLSTDNAANGSAPTFAPAAQLSAFDDSFSVPSEPARVASPPRSLTPMQTQPAKPPSTTGDLFGSAFAPPPSQPAFPPAPKNAEASKTNGTAEGTAADVNDFDEAMGKISNSASNTTSQFSQFSFDSAFDDNFDFAAATAATSPPNAAPVAAPAQNSGFDSIFLAQSTGATAGPSAPSSSSPFTLPAIETKPASFDDVFGAGPSAPQPNAGHPGPSNGSQVISFDDAFGGNTSESLTLDSSFADSSFGGPIQQSPVGLPSQQSSAPFPTSSPPLSPSGRTMSPELYAPRSRSPQRAVSPPPRHSSPKPRPSTGSDKVPPTARHSKLSIRLPFGRKKKTHDAPPLPSGLAQSQIIEDPTPAVDDDVEAVKQLCGMGFSRTQAVAALEAHGYDVQRALNSLLGPSGAGAA